MSYIATGGLKRSTPLVSGGTFVSPTIAAELAANPDAMMITVPAGTTISPAVGIPAEAGMAAGFSVAGLRLPLPLVLVGVAVAGGIFWLWRSKKKDQGRVAWGK